MKDNTADVDQLGMAAAMPRLRCNHLNPILFGGERLLLKIAARQAYNASQRDTL